MGLHDGKVVISVSNVDAQVDTELRRRYPGELIVVKLGSTFVPYDRGAVRGGVTINRRPEAPSMGQAARAGFLAMVDTPTRST